MALPWCDLSRSWSELQTGISRMDGLFACPEARLTAVPSIFNSPVPPRP
jgi:hypothetical protein